MLKSEIEKSLSEEWIDWLFVFDRVDSLSFFLSLSGSVSISILYFREAFFLCLRIRLTILFWQFCSDFLVNKREREMTIKIQIKLERPPD